ncbi:hypothetical protein EOA38_25400 [Mesorhizobium sp. M1E.F.Ca.ET.041.01.1.1]|nr:hypothetical protein EOA38_25400 [Mesorhizobium sp. M1E.F.Ca.ET.041.01.1.1]
MWRRSIGSKRSRQLGCLLDHHIEDHAAPAGGEVELVAVFGIAAAFEDDIGMLFEQADQLLAGGHRLAGQHRRSLCLMFRSTSGR